MSYVVFKTNMNVGQILTFHIMRHFKHYLEIKLFVRMLYLVDVGWKSLMQTSQAVKKFKTQ